ncbi:MAG: branched-chain amino acid ABC transporter permease [Deltaproteobacteria bacterium]|jgi:branched-chain amino acid transport system permease protein|nr:branched-chain amino acid ABC transporter permease [Deltaproteobacteria bacterium]MBT4643122.1 branched-chain amino acid ABC transporter permease [Deltaproteobacteria bacterium]MBT7716053.1 branched-chain amino acid ABC transporter permease [Deltaproteobacteria bacterium]
MLFLQYLISGIMTGGIYGLIGVGIVIIYKATQVFNFAVGTLMTLGALICVSLVTNFNFPFWLALPATLVLAGIIGVLIERIGLRPLLSQPVLSIIMATLAIESILRGLMLMIWTGYTISFPRGLFPGKTIFIGPLFISHEFLIAFVVAMISFALVGLFFYKTQTGLKMRVTAESHDVAMSLGVNITTIFAVAWALAVMVGTLSGVIIGNRLGLQVIITSAVAYKALPAIMLGGLDSVAGAIIGGLIVGVLEKMAGGYIDPKIAEITPYIILLLILMIRPEGIFGLKRIERI